MASTNFKIFNEEMSSDRTFSDSEYEVATQRQVGVIPGMALSRMHNKMYRQSSAMAKAVADFLVSQGLNCMDNDVPGITAGIQSAILKIAGEGIESHNTDKTAHEDIREALKKASSLPLGTIMPFLMNTPPAGFLALDTGALVSRTTYADLWSWAQANAPLISETDWQTQAASQSSVGAYSTGDGSTTFRLPKILDYVRGGLTADVGKWQGDAFQAHKHSSTRTMAASGGGGTVGWTSGSGGGESLTSLGDITTGYVADGANGTPRTANETRPKTVEFLYCVKAFDATSNQGLIDITALANEMAAKVNQTDIGFTIIYPNNGTASNPANVTINSRYVCDNPFLGYNVLCLAEIYINNQWSPAGQFTENVSGNSKSHGMKANQLNDSIVLQTGTTNVVIANALDFAPAVNSTNYTSIPCRIKIWKVGR